MDQDTKKYTILAVDDTPENIDVLDGILHDDYKIKIALNGQKALKIAQSDNPPDLILLDVMMPDIDGYEVCRVLKADKETSEIPIIFITALNKVEDEIKGFELGAVDYIAKPFSPPTVLARVKAHLELRLARENLKKQNEIIKENARLREDVESITRHDLKSSLNAVICIPPMLMEDGNLKSKQVEMLAMLEQSGYHMLHIINSSLDLFKMETGKYQLNPEPVNILKLINQVKWQTQGQISSKGQSVDVLVRGNPAVDGDAFMAQGEEMLCYSILANLFKNAVEASPKGERITISLHEEETPLIKIHNMGTVPLEIRETFFEKYATSGKKGGTGLGTYSASMITETLCGTIQLESSEEAGTSLNVRLPKLLKEPGQEKEESLGDDKSKQSNRTMTILITDDSQHMRQMIIVILRQMGFVNFCEAEDGNEALRILNSEKIDLIISDLNMPGMYGDDLLQQVRSTEGLENIPFFLVTGESLVTST